MTTTNNSQENNGVTTKVEYSKVSVDHVKESQYDGLQAQLRQTVTTTSLYPSKNRIKSSDDALFDAGEFGDPQQSFTNVENRVYWLNVPVGSTKESVQARIDAQPKATLVKTLSSYPELTTQQENSVKIGQRTVDFYANKQVVRYPKDTIKDGQDVSNQLVLDPNGKVQYRTTAFKVTQMPDVDKRVASTEEGYHSAEIEMELKGASVVTGQTL